LVWARQRATTSAVHYGARGLHVDPSKVGPKDRAEIEADDSAGIFGSRKFTTRVY
jgi:hypothetical protein